MMIYKSTFIVAVLLVCASFAMARADLQYTMVTKYSSQEKPANLKQPSRPIVATSTYFVTVNKSRVDSEEGNEIYKSEQVSITRCDLNKKFRIDKSLKIYTVSALAAKEIISKPSKKEFAENLPSGKVATHYSIHEIGTEKIKGISTKIYQVAIRTKYSGVVGDWESTYKAKMWIADLERNNDCNSPLPLNPESTQVQNTPEGKRIMTYENTGDIDEMNKISSKILLRAEGSADYNTSSEQMTQEATSISQKKLNDNIFEVPAGYRKVSKKEYEKLQLQADKKAFAESMNSKAHQ